MTIEQLAEFTSEQFSQMKPEELLEVLKPYFHVTRPEIVRAQTPEQKATRQVLFHQASNMSAEKKAALAQLAAEGVDLSFLNRKKKR